MVPASYSFLCHGFPTFAEIQNNICRPRTCKFFYAENVCPPGERRICASKLIDDCERNKFQIINLELLRCLCFQNILSGKVQVVIGSWCKGMSAGKLSDELMKNVDVAPRSEKYSASFVDAALTIYNRLLSLPTCKETLLQLDEDAGLDNPFNSVFKLNTIISKCGTPDCIEAIVCAFIHAWRAGVLDKADVTQKKLPETTALYMLKHRTLQPIFWWTDKTQNQYHCCKNGVNLR